MKRTNLQSETNYTEEVFKRIDAQSAKISGSTFSRCTFQYCHFAEISFQSCRFIDCQFEHCTMKLAKVDGTTFGRTTFKNCDLMGINWTEADWADWTTKIRAIEFYECNLKYSVFLGLELKKMKMHQCEAQETNFAEADLTEADFRGSDLTGAVFLRTDLTKTSFVGAKNYALNLNDNRTKGTKFSLPQAVRLLHYLDITLVDEDTEQELLEGDINTFI